jgi:glutathione S-transferase
MRARLVGVVGSHPCVSVELMLRYKGVDFTRLDLPNMTHKALLPLLRHRGSTVPVMTLDGHRISGTMKIARALEHLVPEPPLFPQAERASVEGAEAWADGALQDGIRQLARWALGRDPEAMASFITDPLLGVIPADLVRKAVPVLRPTLKLQMRVKDETARAALEALPAQLDRVDALLAEGVIGGERPNAADFQIAPSVRLMLTFDQLRGPIDARPAGAHARRLVPDYPGRFREVFPATWLAF